MGVTRAATRGCWAGDFDEGDWGGPPGQKSFRGTTVPQTLPLLNEPQCPLRRHSYVNLFEKLSQDRNRVGGVRSNLAEGLHSYLSERYFSGACLYPDIDVLAVRVEICHGRTESKLSRTNPSQLIPTTGCPASCSRVSMPSSA